MPGRSLSDAERIALAEEYFDTARSARGISAELDTLAADRSVDSAAIAALEGRLETMRDRQSDIRDDVEETIESAVSAAIRSQGFASLGAFVFPPVDVRLLPPPKVLVSSPRDRIERLDDVLVSPDVTVREREAIESRLAREEGLSTLVLDIGGVATYPATVLDSHGLRSVLNTAAHEWVHHYLFFRPLGRNPYSSSEILSINETTASLAGDELGSIAFESMSADSAKRDAEQPATEQPAEYTEPPQLPSAPFDFSSEMRETRLNVDRLLEEGMVEDAESYMEERRQEFAANGYPIRKLNQAYFAFHGTYAESSASSSPIGEQVRKLRERSGSLPEFIHAIASVSSHEEFLALIAEL